MNFVTIDQLLAKPVCMMTGEELTLLLQHLDSVGHNNGCRLADADNGIDERSKDRRELALSMSYKEEKDLRSTARMSAEEISVSKRYVYGVAGIAETFGCSIPTASRIKASGVIDDAITQVGRKIIVDPDLALKLAKEAKANGIDVAKANNTNKTIKK